MVRFTCDMDQAALNVAHKIVQNCTKTCTFCCTCVGVNGALNTITSRLKKKKKKGTLLSVELQVSACNGRSCWGLFVWIFTCMLTYNWVFAFLIQQSPMCSVTFAVIQPFAVDEAVGLWMDAECGMYNVISGSDRVTRACVYTEMISSICEFLSLPPSSLILPYLTLLTLYKLTTSSRISVWGEYLWMNNTLWRWDQVMHVMFHNAIGSFSFNLLFYFFSSIRSWQRKHFRFLICMDTRGS